ncbi:hypothetical protein ACS3SW_20350 [Roseobacteraceae bacterium S113]
MPWPRSIPSPIRWPSSTPQAATSPSTSQESAHERCIPLRSRAGRVLWHELPEEYRFRDRRDDDELGDLEAFLHGAGHLLDLIRNTTEQAYADAFAEPVDDRAIQPWLLPYLAELVGARLVAPDPAQRTRELNNSVGWYKSKGTLSALDSLADVVAGTETVSREGWRHVLTTPRMGLPPFTAPQGQGDGETMTASMMPRGCPDVGRPARAVRDAEGANPLFRLSANRDEPGSTAQHWRLHNPTGAPCFPGAYDDAALRTPDLRDADGSGAIGPHPRRTLIHVRPPQGLFSRAIQEAGAIDTATVLKAVGMVPGAREVITAERVCAHLGLPETTRLRLPLPKNLTIPKGLFTFRGLIFTDHKRITLAKGAWLAFEDCALPDLSAPTGASRRWPQISLKDCLVRQILAPASFLRCEYVTVTGACDVDRLEASDSLFGSLGDTLTCTGETPSCLRFSAVANPGALAGPKRACLGGTNTTHGPNFIRLWLPDDAGGPCVLRAPKYGEPGHGVLDLTSHMAILQGAEDAGEMGVYHGAFHAAAIRALEAKAQSFLPIGQEITCFYDPLLAHMPPELVGA